MDGFHGSAVPDGEMRRAEFIKAAAAVLPLHSGDAAVKHTTRTCRNENFAYETQTRKHGGLTPDVS